MSLLRDRETQVDLAALCVSKDPDAPRGTWLPVNEALARKRDQVAFHAPKRVDSQNVPQLANRWRIPSPLDESHKGREDERLPVSKHLHEALFFCSKLSQ